MSPGVLLSTGYIAGGTIAAVIMAMLNFSDTLVRWLSAWQCRQLHDWPSLAAFAGLALALVLVGTGLLLRDAGSAHETPDVHSQS